MEKSGRSRQVFRLPAGVAATNVVLLGVLIALLGIWNEIRFQGCISRSSREAQINITAKRIVVGVTSCHRLPFRP
jgi:hypothetical protein